MPQQINKKIIFYFFLFIILGTFNNKNLDPFTLPKIETLKIYGSEKIDDEFIRKLEFFKMNNILFVNKFEIKKVLETNNLIEEYKIFKKYPSILEIEIIETKFLAKTNKDGKTFFVGSNGKFIETKNEIENLPFIFGDFDINNFLELKKIIDISKLNFTEINNLYFFPSGRWDIESLSGILIKLPNQKIKESLDLSLDLIDNKKFSNIKIIDIRQKNQVIIDEQWN